MCPLKDMGRWNCSSANVSTSPLQSLLKGKWKPEAARTPSPSAHSGHAGVVVMGSGSPKLSASLTNWIKLHWWNTSCIPLWPPCSAGFGRNSKLIIPVLFGGAEGEPAGLSRGGSSGWSRAGMSTASARREQQHLLPPDDTDLTAMSPSMPRGNELWFKPLEVFLLGLSLTALFLFYLLDFKFSFRHRNVWVPCQQRRDLCAVQIIVCLCLAQNPGYNIFFTS